MASTVIPCGAPGCDSPSKAAGLCSKHYQRLRIYGHLKPQARDCEQCGKSFEPKTNAARICSQKCHWTKKNRKCGAKPLEQAKAERKANAWKGQCPECGIWFGANAEGHKKTYCSVSCGLACRRRYGEAARQLRIWGSRERTRIKAIEALHAYVIELRPRLCGCGNALTKHKRLCAGCSYANYRKTKNNAPSRRAAKAYRKALQRGAVDGAERFDPLEVLARDGWRCHICGISTPKHLRGSYHDNAPELDHIIPLSLGGPHTRINTACACRKCNGNKGASIIGQLRLVA